jgi:nicotinamidase-related amidase
MPANLGERSCSVLEETCNHSKQFKRREPLMTLDPDASALVLVDYQTRLLPSIHDAERVLQHAVLLANVAREIGIAVYGTEENPEGLGHNDERIRALCDETLVKMRFDACGDGLAERLGPVRQVVVAGCEAHVCLLQTALGLRSRGYDVFAVHDACGSRRERDKALAMERLRQAGAVLASLEMVAFEWLRTCEHPKFRHVLQRVKALPA